MYHRSTTEADSVLSPYMRETSELDALLTRICRSMHFEVSPSRLRRQLRQEGVEPAFLPLPQLEHAVRWVLLFRFRYPRAGAPPFRPAGWSE